MSADADVEMMDPIARPRVVLERVDEFLWRARCLECPWSKGPTAKSWLEQYEARPHRADHREGRVPAELCSCSDPFTARMTGHGHGCELYSE